MCVKLPAMKVLSRTIMVRSTHSLPRCCTTQVTCNRYHHSDPKGGREQSENEIQQTTRWSYETCLKLPLFDTVC